MKIAAIIPARAGSKGIPNKNIRELGGKPLIQHTLDLCSDLSGVDAAYVSTDSEVIARTARECGAIIPDLRPKSLATDSATTVEVLIDLIPKIVSHGGNYDAFLLLQCTVPFRSHMETEGAIEKFRESEYDSLVSVRKVPDHYNPHWVLEPDSNGWLRIATGEEEIITRRQLLPPAFYRDGSVYLFTNELISSTSRILGEKLGYFENQSANHINLDTMDDWREAEEIVSSGK